MEQWESLLDDLPTSPDVRYYGKAIQTAGVLLKEDLAIFETEWILQTLLHKPINLLSTIDTYNNNAASSKLLIDYFKLISDHVDKWRDVFEIYFEDIVHTCNSTKIAQIRKYAIQCLTRVARQSSVAASNIARHIASLEQTQTGVAATATLIGTICEFHPETVISDDVTNIWRIFLNLLDSNKNTDTIRTAILQGILSLFKNFGCDLPTVELNEFYDKLTAVFVKIKPCENVCVEILTSYPKLFAERISRDQSLRHYLWSNNHHIAARSCSMVICDSRNSTNIQTLLRELQLHAQSSNSQTKYEALRILHHIHTNLSIVCMTDINTDVQCLEFQLSSGAVDYDTALAISFSIDCNLPNSDKLIQTSVLCYHNLPASTRKSTVVYGILNAPPDIRNGAVTFLTTESIQDEKTIETYIPLWRDIFDMQDSNVIEKCKYAFEDFMTNVICTLKHVIEEDGEKPPEKLQHLHTLASQILIIHNPEDYTRDLTAVYLPVLVAIIRQFGSTAAAVAAGRAACLHLENESCIKEFYETITIDRCMDEPLLCESCLALIYAPPGIVHDEDVVTALQITFSRNDVDHNVLTKALQKFESIITMKTKNIINIEQILRLVEKLPTRTDISVKESRVLHRDVLMFLGRHGVECDMNNNVNSCQMIAKLKDTLTLDIKNPIDGLTYKLNLQRILQLAIIHGEADTLQILMTIVCAHLSTRKDPILQSVLTRILHALSVAHAQGHSVNPKSIQQAVLLCDDVTCVQSLIRYISTEKSPGVRKMLSDSLEGLLTQNTASELTERLVGSVAEICCVMMSSRTSLTRRAGLNITEILTEALKYNNSLTKKLLPEIITLISNSFEMDSVVTFENASKLFIEKIELFDEDTVEKLTKRILQIFMENNKTNMVNFDCVIFKKCLKINLEFAKNIIDYQKEEKSKILRLIFDCFEKQNLNFQKYLHVLAEVKNIFDLNTELCRNVVTYKNCTVTKRLFFMDVDNYFCMETVLKFLESYEAVLLEIEYQNTLQFLSNLVKNLTPETVKHLHRNLKSCLSVFMKNRTPSKLLSSFDSYCQKLPLNEITDSLNKELFTNEHACVVNSVKIMLDVFNLTDLSTVTAVRANVISWPTILLKLFSTGYITNYLRSKIDYLTDILTVSVKFLTVNDIKKIILEGVDVCGVSNEKIGIKFCQYFIGVFYDYLVRTPFILLDDDMASCCILLNDVIKHALTKKINNIILDNILDLVNQLWPTYEQKATLEQKLSLLLNMTNLPKKLTAMSNPMMWAISVINSDAISEEKSRLIGVLPGGDEFCQTYRSFASTLPTRLSEISSGTHASFRSMLDALAATRDLQLLNIIVTLSSGDETTGWWDEAIDNCMRALAANDSSGSILHHCQWREMPLAASRRVLIPLLRYSPSTTVERYYSTILKDILSTIQQKRVVISRTKLLEYTTVLSLIQIAFEKMNSTSLASPSSTLYSEIKPQQTWYLVREVCKACVRFNEVRCSDSYKEVYRNFQIAKYNCLCAAICKKRPEEKIYTHIFDKNMWANLVDQDYQYNIKLRSLWNQRTKHAPISVDVETSEHTNIHTGTVRTRMFLRTLSENPLQYDLIVDDAEETVLTHDLELYENELNNHGSAPTLTAVICHISSMGFSQWKDTLAAALSGDLHRNCKWFLAQAICNCKTELKPHASTLRPALLAAIADTVIEEDGKKLLNGLHVDILNTIIHWSDPIPPFNNLNVIIEALIRTSLENRHRTNIFKMLQDTLSGVLDKCEAVDVGWSSIEPYLNDSTASKTVQILIRLTKSKIYIPELLPSLLMQLETRKRYQVAKMGELFGCAMAVSSIRGDTSILKRWKDLLKTLQRDRPSEYVRMIYYAQREYSGCCDEDQFRTVTDLTVKLLHQDKAKCLLILSAYISNSNSAYAQDMFETIELSELILNESIEALSIVREGLCQMEEGLKRRVVIQASGLCRHTDWKVREASFAVVVKAFQDIFKPSDQQQPKKPRSTSTQILQSINTDDIYVKTVLSSVGLGLTDRNNTICRMVRANVVGYLHKEDFAIRFTECIYLAILQPTTANKSADLSVCAAAMLELLFAELRSHDRFKLSLLRDDPVEFSNVTSGPSKLLTMSRTYQGTFRTGAMTSKMKKKHTRVTKTPDIDVQITIDSILETFLKFAKDIPEASQALCVQLSKCIQSPGFDFGPNMSVLLSDILKNGAGDVTPLVLDLCRVFVGDVWKVNGFQTTLFNLLSEMKSTEGQHIVKLLHEDVTLRSNDESIVLGANEEIDDVFMEDKKPFSLDDLTSMFNKLSNWNDLTIQQRRNIENSGLPTLWTDDDVFKTALENYTGTDGWFSKMVSGYRQEDQQNAMKWLREIDRWPRRRFAMSAVTEAIEWQTRMQREEIKFSCNIQPSDCIAEWAARLMIRSANFSMETDSEQSCEQSVLSRLHELSWTKRANEMALPSLALECVNRNVNKLNYESETLSWLHERLSARRSIGLKKNDPEILRKALGDAVTYTPKFAVQSTSETNISMNFLTMQLHFDLNSITVDKTNSVLQDLNVYTRDSIGDDDLNRFYDLGVTFLDGVWKDSDTTQQNTVLSTMLNILDRVSGQFRREMFLNVILNRLDEYCHTLPEDLAKKILDLIETLSPDEFTFTHISKLRNLFPSHLLPLYSSMRERDGTILLKYKKYLHLICDAEYTLFKYCEELLHTLNENDQEKWTKLFDRMKEKIFENPYKGSDYQLLTTYRERLYELNYYAQKPTKQALEDICRRLNKTEPKKVLRLSQLCPLLNERVHGDSDACLAKLLGLKPGITVLKFDQQVSVIIDSIRRPTILRALLSNGTYVQYLIKSGEPLVADAAAQRVVRHAGLMWREKIGCNYVVSYKVTPLSDDCGLIEYLEDHDRLRSLISNEHTLACLAKIRRPDDAELLLNPITSLVQKHNQLRCLVPKYTLRDAILKTCVNTQEFVSKRLQFEKTIAGVTVLGWILGLGDRHLENILSMSDGSVCCVDWASLLTHGFEPPARLTNNIVAVCCNTVLESRIQRLLSTLRQSRKLLLPFVRTAFKWMKNITEKYPQINSMLSGTALSYDITRESINNSSIEHRDKYIQVLDDVFEDFETRDVYSIEEQVSCLLRHCTDPRILSVTRSGWEPWI